MLARTTVLFTCLTCSALARGPYPQSIAEWEGRRTEIVQAMTSIMGALPDASKRISPDLQVEEEIDRGTYVVRRVTYRSEPGNRVPAYLCIPRALLAPGSTQRAPAVLCLHPTHRTVGAGVNVGLGATRYPPYASELAERGFVTLSPNYPLLADYQPDLASLGYASGTMKAIWDNIRALDVLDALPYVRPGKYAAIGHSLGGHNSLFTAVFEPRIRLVVTSCGFDSFLEYAGSVSRVWAPEQGWCQSRYMPRLASYAGRLEEIPFDFDDILAALAPRRVMVCAPIHDGNFRRDSVEQLIASAQPVFRLLSPSPSAPSSLTVEYPDCEHDFPLASRQRAYDLAAEILR